MSLNIDDFRYSDNDDEDEAKEVNSDAENESNVVFSKKELIDKLLCDLEINCRRDNNLMILMKSAKTVIPDNYFDLFSSIRFPDLNIHDLEKKKELLLYLRQIHCEYLVEKEILLLKEFAAKCLEKEAENPHFGLKISWSHMEQAFKYFIILVSFIFVKEKPNYTDFSKDEIKSVCEKFFENGKDIWNDRLENFRDYCNNEFEFSTETTAYVFAAMSTSNRGSKIITRVRTMLLLFEFLPMDCYKITRPSCVKIPKANKKSRKPKSYPLCIPDVDKCLNKCLNDSYDPTLLPKYLRSPGARFIHEPNVYYLLLTDFSKCLKLKLSIKLGIRLCSINHEAKPELSLKVNDLKVIMISPMCFKLDILVKIFKTGQLPTHFVVFPDNSTFDLTTMMVIYLANRNLFTLPLRDCMETGNFELKKTEEYLFPSFDMTQRMHPSSTFKHRPSYYVTRWFRDKMNLPNSLMNASSPRKGHFIQNFAKFIEACPHSTMARIYNMICSRGGWESKVCWSYGHSPLMNTELFQNIYIHHVKTAMDAGDPKPEALLFVPTVTTVAYDLGNAKEDKKFQEEFKKQMENRKLKENEHKEFIEFITSLNLDVINGVTTKCLEKMKRFIKYTESARNQSQIQKKWINKWKEEHVKLSTEKIIYGKPEQDFRRFNLQAIANDTLTAVCHVFDEKKESYNHPVYWCKKCKTYIEKQKNERKNRHKLGNTTSGRNKFLWCENNLIDRRFIKVVFEEQNETLTCGCIRGKCLKFDPSIRSLLNFASMSTTARVCYEEETSDPKSLKECLKKIFLNRVQMRIGVVPSCAHEIFDISSRDYFPSIDEDAWALISSDFCNCNFGNM